MARNFQYIHYMRILFVLAIIYWNPIASASLTCSQLYNNSTMSFPAGKSKSSLERIDDYFRAHQRPGYLTLYRGQRRLTQKLPSIIAREFGIEASIAKLNEAIKKKESQLTAEREWLAQMVAKNAGKNPILNEIYDRKENELSKLTAVDLVVIDHSHISANSSFVSTSSSIEIASGNYQGGSRNRYIYILQVPESLPVKTFEARIKKNAQDQITDELEYSIPHDATEFVIGAIDLITGHFISTEAILAKGEPN